MSGGGGRRTRPEAAMVEVKEATEFESVVEEEGWAL